MTFKQFVESTWFKGLARGAMLFGLPTLSATSAFVGYTLSGVQAEQSLLKREVAEITQTQTTRAQVNDEFQTDITSEVVTVKNALFLVQTDVATIKGILQEMQRRDIALTSLVLPIQ